MRQTTARRRPPARAAADTRGGSRFSTGTRSAGSEVLDLLREAGTVNTIGIVDVDPQTIHERLERKFGPLAKVQYLPGKGFSGWAQSLDVERFFQSIAASG